MEKHPTPLLYRIVFCPECGQRFRAKAINGHPRSYQKKNGEVSTYIYETCYYVHPPSDRLRRPDIQCRCANQVIQTQDLDRQVWNDLLEFFVLSEDQKKEIARLAATPVHDPVEGQRRRLERRRRNLEVRYLDDEISKDDYFELKEEIQRDLKNLPVEVTPIAIPPEVAIERLGSVVKMLQSSYAQDSEEVNSALRAIIEKVYVDDREVVAYTPRHWCAALFPPEKRRAPSS